MKSRAEAVELIFRQLEDMRYIRRKGKSAHHYGRVELRELLDFIYESEPKSYEERIPRQSSIMDFEGAYKEWKAGG